MNKKRLLYAFLVTQLLFFIDEGFYDFRWMKSLGNWIVFIPYLIAVYLLFSGVNFLIKRIKKPN